MLAPGQLTHEEQMLFFPRREQVKALRKEGRAVKKGGVCRRKRTGASRSGPGRVRAADKSLTPAPRAVVKLLRGKGQFGAAGRCFLGYFLSLSPVVSATPQQPPKRRKQPWSPSSQLSTSTASLQDQAPFPSSPREF